MRSKKVVLIIVEGPSDETALRLILEKAFDQSRVFVQVVHGDVTSDDKSAPSNIVKKVNELIKANMRRNRYARSDLLLVIHLMDTDGAYISGDAIIEVPSARRVLYNVTQVIASDKCALLKRNGRKAANMDRLATLPQIGGVPYLAVFMSCNLDHVLHNKVNSSDDEKRRDAFEFAKKYRSDIPAFIDFISNSDFSVVGERGDTWDYIRKDLRSIERHTNMGLCFAAPYAGGGE